jgi:phospholipid/cholesterol/gamma-HCH transport system substrate-binding protein
MSDKRADIQVGLFSIIAILLLAMMILIFGGFKNVLIDTYRITARFDNAAGATEGTPVRLLGIEVGNVKSVTLDTEAGGVCMVLILNKSADIRKDAPLAIKQEGFIANLYLDFGLGTSDELLPKDGTAVIEGSIDTFAAYIERATMVMSDMGSSIKDKVTDVSDQLLKLLDDLDELAGDEQFRTDLKEVVSHTSDIAGTLKGELPSLLEKVQSFAGKAETSIDEASDLLKIYRELGLELTETAKVGREQIARQGENLDRLTGALTQGAVDVSALANSLRDIAETVNSGEGTTGRLLKDPELYRSLVAAIDELELAAREIRQLAETIKKHPDWLLKGAPPNRR